VLRQLSKWCGAAIASKDMKFDLPTPASSPPAHPADAVVTDGHIPMTSLVKIGVSLFIIGLPLIVASAMIILLAVAAWAPAIAVSVVAIGLAVFALGVVWLLRNPQILNHGKTH
jgi:hypothetical protein